MKTLLQIALVGVVLVGTIMMASRGVPADATPSLDSKTRDAIVAALDDERKAQATYQAVIDRFGDVMPYVNIIRAEVRHERNLLTLFDKYGVPVPTNTWSANDILPPNTLQAAYQQGVEFEKANAAMYTRFLEFVKEEDIRTVFEYNRGASVENHLRAFERFATGSGPGLGRGNGPGMGGGNGSGQGRGGCRAAAGSCCRN